MKQRKVPMRKCTGCREMKPKMELIRVVKAPDVTNEAGEIVEKGAISLDLTSKKSGRGAYICPSAACLKKARKRLEANLECTIPEEVFQNLEMEIERNSL